MLLLLAEIPSRMPTAHAFIAPITRFYPLWSRPSSSRSVVDWFQQEPLESLLPRDEALAICMELVETGVFSDPDSQRLTKENWDRFASQRLSNETRSLRDVLGASTTQRLLASVEASRYDPDAVRTFLSSSAVNSLFTVILYDAISEFLVKMDVFGNIVNSLPIIGPVRRQLTQQFKQSLDKSLGPLIQTFLQAYTSITVRESVDFVLSEDNQRAFASANVKLVSSLLDRPINRLILSETATQKVIDDTFAYLQNDVSEEDVERFVDAVYDVLHDKTIQNAVNVDKVLEASPTLQRTLDRLWETAVANSNNTSQTE